MDASRRGGEKFWTSRQGGAKNFGQAAKGGRKILDLVNFFSMFLKHNFSCFVGILGTFNFLVKGGAKNFGRVAKEGRKFLDVSFRGGEKFWTLIFLESLGKIKGHV